MHSFLDLSRLAGRGLGTLTLAAALLGGTAAGTAHAAPPAGPERQCMQVGTMIQCMGPGGMQQQSDSGSGGMGQYQGPGGSVQYIAPGTPGAPPAPAAAPAPLPPLPALPPIQIQSSEAMPALATDTPLAIGVARGEGGAYHLGESLNVAYAVNQALTIRVVAIQGEAITTL